METAEKLQNLMKISKLSEITGVPRDSIHYYIREGLLPEPFRTKKNMAYYDQSFVERIKLIKELQTKRFLPLNVIKQILNESEENIGVNEIKTILELDGKLFKNMDAIPDIKPVTFEELVEMSGLPADEVRELIALGIISPENGPGGGVFDEDCICIVEIWSNIRRSGFTEEMNFSVELLEIYRDIIEVLAKKEVEIFASRVSGNVSDQERVKMAESAVHLINGLIGRLRKRSILKVVREFGMQFR